MSSKVNKINCYKIQIVKGDNIQECFIVANTYIEARRLALDLYNISDDKTYVINANYYPIVVSDSILNLGNITFTTLGYNLTY